MRIVLAGLAGDVDLDLVRNLQNSGATVLLVGRDPATTQSTYPNCRVAAYSEIAEAAHGYDLAVCQLISSGRMARSSDQEALESAAGFAQLVAMNARGAGVGHIVYICSSEPLERGMIAADAAKRHLANLSPETTPGIRETILYVPTITRNRPTAGLVGLRDLSSMSRSVWLALTGALRRQVDAGDLADAILRLDSQSEAEASLQIASSSQAANPIFGASKRIIDLAFALAILGLLWWAMALVWVAVRVQSPGPGIFVQKRVGRNEKVFSCYKFRTMHVATPQLGTHEVSASAVTPLGKFLRRTKLDELPQVFNILLNQMSLVGPRPCLPSQTELIQKRREKGVFSIMPGITGLAQINDVDMSDPARLVDLDRQYLDLQSLKLDFRIILATASGSGSGDRTK